MGWFSILLSGLATYFLYKTGNIVLMVIAIVDCLGCFWSWGVMHNYATNLAKQRKNYSGDFYDIREYEAQGVPDWITIVNMLFTLLGVALLVIGIIFMLR
ncbi:hypothetical protein ACFL4O_01560 [bacterium]